MTTEMNENNSKNTTEFKRNSVDCVEKSKNEASDCEKKINKSFVKLKKTSVCSADNKYVIVKYEDCLYPGHVLEKKGNSLLVSTMVKSGADWKWPNQKDILSYEKEDVLEYISEPKLKNNRRVYVVSEMDKYKDFSS